MRSLFVAARADSARAPAYARILREHGYEPDVRAAGERTADPFAYAIVFFDLAMGADTIIAETRTFTALGAQVPPLLAIVGIPRPEESDRLIAAGANLYVNDDPETFSLRIRFLQRAVDRRSHFAETMAALRESEGRYRTVIAAVDHGLVVQDTKGKVTTYNPAAQRMFGLTDSEIVDRVWATGTWSFFSEDGSSITVDDLPSRRALVTGVADGGRVIGVRRPNGRIVWASTNSHPVAGADGTTIAVVTTLIDVTERHEAEDHLRAFLERAPDPTAITNVRGVTLWTNKKWATLLGYDDPRALAGRPIVSFLAPRLRPDAVTRISEGPAGPEPAAPSAQTLVKKDGVEVPVTIFRAPIMYAGEQAYVSFARDLTEQRRLEMQLMATDRLAALGRLAAGVGHEINNPLTYVIGNLRAALDRLDETSGAGDLSTMIAEAMEGAERVRRIVRDLKVLASRQTEQVTAVDLHKVLESCIRMATSELRPRAQIDRDLVSVPFVRANEARLAQVFLNLLINAAQAIPEGKANANTVTVSTRLDADGKVVVVVRDTGIGVAPEHLPHVFEPFFTTKTDRGGTGLGLSICHMLVTSLGGHISIESDARGTAVTVRLPAEEPAVAAARDGGLDGGARSGSRTKRRVLVIDDEVRIALLIREGLAGHDVTVASSGREALAHVESGPFDVVVCDLMMPDLSGIDVYERLRTLRPGLEQRVVFITGGAFTERAIGFLSEVGNACLEKPFPLGELAAAIDEAARRGAPS